MKPDLSLGRAVNCPGCGVARLLPRNLKMGDTFALVPCPRCGQRFRGRYFETDVEALDFPAPQLKETLQ